uniref:Uncharacterized protein n=1 Tax=Ananas comosus var. bracteatus TaxID=296719 RepID=A0A6V7NPU9_ANACO|nr:unnamed protein product [Ananas comosus var. bracteatus]
MVAREVVGRPELGRSGRGAPGTEVEGGEAARSAGVEGKTSGQSDQQAPSLAQALGQMTRVLQVLDQNSHRSTARLDVVLAAITASNENIARNKQLLTQNE